MCEGLLAPVGAIDPATIKKLAKAGVIVVETEAPERLQFIRASVAVGADDLLFAAIGGLNAVGGYGEKGVTQRDTFVKLLFEALGRDRQKKAPKPAEDEDA